MFDRSDVTYSYDGSFEGFLCCVFESYMKKETPMAIYNQKDEQLHIFPSFNIPTDMVKAKRVKKSIPSKMGAKAMPFLRSAFLTCLEQKELHMLNFMYLGYSYGKKALDMLSNDTVHALQKAVQHLYNEVHEYQGYVRFSLHEDLMLATIKPKNYVLSLLGPHFSERFPNEKFLIYDKTHHMLYAHEQGKVWVAETTEMILPDIDEEEKYYRSLWQMFYDTIAIKERITPSSLKYSRTRNRYLQR